MSTADRTRRQFEQVTPLIDAVERLDQINRPYTDFPEIPGMIGESWAHIRPHESDTDRLRRAHPYADTLKTTRKPRRDPLAWLERQLTLAVSIVVACLAALASALGIVVAGFAFMVVVGGGLGIVTATLNALPWELLAVAVILALLWRAQGSNVRR